MKHVCFITVLSVRHARSNERVARRREKFAFYHSFERSTRTKSREGCQGQPKNSRFTTVLDIRHVQSDERVARPRKKFAFYHSFERPTRPKWRKGRSASREICVLPQFWTSDTSEVMKGSIGWVKNLRFTSVLSVRHARSDERVVKSTGAIPAPQTEKEYILTLFRRFWLAIFSLQSFLLYFRQPSLQQNFQQSFLQSFRQPSLQ